MLNLGGAPAQFMKDGLGLSVEPVPFLIATMEINTVGGVAVDSKEVYRNASFTITDRRGREQTGTLRIRGRGNYTWTLPKKPYRLNFDVSYAPLGLNAVQKNWALLASHEDPRKIAHMLGLYLGQQMTGLVWTPQFHPVEVTLNGSYEGLYLLTDLVRREAGRVPGPGVSGTSGDALTGTWLAEISRRYIGEGAPGFTTPRDTMIQYEDPEVDLAGAEPGATQADYFRDWIEAFENKLFGLDFTDAEDGYAQHVDMNSFADWYLVNELGSNQDSWFESSVKLWKQRDSLGGKLFMGPLWDFGISFGNVVNVSHNPEGWNTINTNSPGATWIKRMISDPAFKAALLDRWEVVKTKVPALLAGVDRFLRIQQAAIYRDETRWSFPHIEPLVEAAFVKDWITDRVEWLDANLPSLTGSGTWLLDTEAPSAPSGLDATSITATGFTLSWNASTDNVAVTQYRYRRDGGVPTVVGNVLSTPISGLIPETEYDFEVAAGDASNNWSAWSTALPVTTLVGSGWVETAQNLWWNASFEHPEPSNVQTVVDGVNSLWSTDWARTGTHSIKLRGRDGDFYTEIGAGVGGLFGQGRGASALVPGATYTVSGYFHQDAPQTISGASHSRARRINFHHNPGGGGYAEINSPAATNVAGTERVSFTFTFDATATSGFFRLYSGAGHADDICYWDDVMIEPGNVLHDYFDGSTPDTATERYTWLGPPWDSVSIKEELM